MAVLTTLVAAVVLLLLAPRDADAHARWACPTPRNPNTGIKARTPAFVSAPPIPRPLLLTRTHTHTRARGGTRSDRAEAKRATLAARSSRSPPAP